MGDVKFWIKVGWKKYYSKLIFLFIRLLISFKIYKIYICFYNYWINEFINIEKCIM